MLTDNKHTVDQANSTLKRIKVDISLDAYEAYATVDEADLQPTHLQAALEAEGVVYGIDNAAALLAVQNQGQRTLVANGSRHTDGADGYFEPSKKEVLGEAETKFGIRNVYVGNEIGVINLPTPGSVGVDVYGRKVQPKPGKSVNFFTGETIKRHESGDKIRLEAAVDGYLHVGEASIEVATEHILSGDLDYSDGELAFAGSLRVVGDVKGSSRLKVRHNLVIDGSVEDAKIIAGGDVKVTGSFVGRGDGLIRAGGNAEVKVVLNQMIEAGGCVTILKESVNAHLIASDSIIAKNAIIMGGIVAAGEKIEVQTLGGELYSTTKAKLGIKEILTEDMGAIDKEIELISKEIESMKAEIYTLVRDRIDGNAFTSEKADRLKQLQANLQRQNDSVKELNTRKQTLVADMTRKRNPKLIIRGTIHPSVAAEINGVRVPIKQSHQNVTFEESKYEILRTKNL